MISVTGGGMVYTELQELFFDKQPVWQEIPTRLAGSSSTSIKLRKLN